MMDYQPREAFRPYHTRDKRFTVMVAHRRAGKTVSCVTDLLTAAVSTRKQNARYAYVAPFYSQAKQVAWDYIKRFGENVIIEARESDLSVTVRNGHGDARIRLYGADNPDTLRGIYLDGVVLDEYGDMKPSLWGSVIRPVLADRKGWATFIGTPKGRNHFYDLYAYGLDGGDGDWLSLRLPASETGILDPNELAAARRTMTDDQYAAEFECSFDAAILGAFYGKEMREAEDAGRIVRELYDPALPVMTSWDLGYSDDTAIWFAQAHRGEIRLIDYAAFQGEDIPTIAAAVLAKPYKYTDHWLPHDARAKTLASGGRSTVEQLFAMGIKGKIAPMLSVQDGIQAARVMLATCYFDKDKCGPGLEALRQYQREYDEDRKAFRQKERVDWTNHAADAFRYLAVAWRENEGKRAPPKPRFLNEMTVDELWQATRGRSGGRI
jgi:hypothetical protein